MVNASVNGEENEAECVVVGARERHQPNVSCSLASDTSSAGFVRVSDVFAVRRCCVVLPRVWIKREVNDWPTDGSRLRRVVLGKVEESECTHTARQTHTPTHHRTCA